LPEKVARGLAVQALGAFGAGLLLPFPFPEMFEEFVPDVNFGRQPCKHGNPKRRGDQNYLHPEPRC
jgi:hypothetical protein